MTILINERGASEDLYRVLEKDRYSRGKSDISVTELIAPPRIRQLLKRHGDKIKVDVSDSVYALFGKLTHEIMQQIKLNLAGDNSDLRLEYISRVLKKLENNEIDLLVLPELLQQAISDADADKVYREHKRLIEIRFFTEFEGLIISGQVDDLRENEELINDHKVCSRYTAMDEAGKDEWIKQLNVYRWLAKRNGKKISKLTIEAYYRDWSKRQAARDPSYPQSQTQMFNIEVWPDDKIEEYVKTRVRLHKMAEELEDSMLPVCSEEERWAVENKWAVTKPGRVRAIRVLDSQHEAADWIRKNIKPGEKLNIEKRDGTSIRCESYCDAWSVCEFGRMVRSKMRNPNGHQR